MADPKLDLEWERAIAAPRAKVWRAWREPDIFKTWWSPKPWTTELLAFELRSGGPFRIRTRGPDGTSMEYEGLYPEVVPAERIVMTSALMEGWRPSSAPHAQTSIITLSDEGAGTRFRLIGIGVSHLEDATGDDFADLIDRRAAEAEHAVDKLREKFGKDAVVKGLALDEE